MGRLCRLVLAVFLAFPGTGVTQHARLGTNIPASGPQGGFSPDDLFTDTAHSAGCFRVPTDADFTNIDYTGTVGAAVYYPAGNSGNGSLIFVGRANMGEPPYLVEISVPSGTLGDCTLASSTWPQATKLHGLFDPSEGQSTDCVDNFSPFPTFTGQNNIKYPGAGLTVPGGKFHTYVTGTTTNQTTYSNTGRSIANSNPITLDGSGQATVYPDPTLTYRFVLKDATDTTTIWDSEFDSTAVTSWGSLTGHSSDPFYPIKHVTRTSKCPDYAVTPTWGTDPSWPSDGDYKLGGLYIDGSDLYFSYFQYYDGGGTQRRAIAKRSLTWTNDESFVSMYGMGDGSTKQYDGAIAAIPAAYQAGLKGTVMSSHLGAPIISLASQGPSAYVWTPGTWANPIPHEVALAYPCAHPVNGLACGGTDVSSIWSLTSHSMGMVIPEGFPNLLYFEKIGAGQCYGSGGGLGGNTLYPLGAAVLPGNADIVLESRREDGDGTPHNSLYYNQLASIEADRVTVDLPNVDLSSFLSNNYGIWVGTTGNNGKGNVRNISSVSGSGTASAKVVVDAAFSGSGVTSGLKWQVGIAGDDASTSATYPQNILLPNRVLAPLVGIHVQLLDQVTPDGVGGIGNDPTLITRPGVVYIGSVTNDGTGTSTAVTGNNTSFGSPSVLTGKEWVGGEINCMDAFDPSNKGNHGAPYLNTMLRYSLTELESVVAGTLTIYAPQPAVYDVTSLFTWGNGLAVETEQAAYDGPHKRIFFVVKGGDGSYPAIQVITHR